MNASTRTQLCGGTSVADPWKAGPAFCTSHETGDPVVNEQANNYRIAREAVADLAIIISTEAVEDQSRHAAG